MLIAFMACISGVSNTCIHAWPIYGCIGSCLHIGDNLDELNVKVEVYVF